MNCRSACIHKILLQLFGTKVYQSLSLPMLFTSQFLHVASQVLNVLRQDNHELTGSLCVELEFLNCKMLDKGTRALTVSQGVVFA